MSNQPEEQSTPGPDELPELAQALRALDAEGNAGAPAIPAALDSAIREAARARFTTKPSGTIRLLPWLSVAAAAAALLITAGVWAGRGPLEPGDPSSTTSPSLDAEAAAGNSAARETTPNPVPAAPTPPVPAATIAGDVNTDGRLDIIDAYLVARRAKQRGDRRAVEPRWDHNGDGSVTRADADAIALAAVTLPEGSHK